MFDPYSALARSLEREERLRIQLKELLTCIDESTIGPASSIIPAHQLVSIELILDASEEEMAMLEDVISNLPEDLGEDMV